MANGFDKEKWRTAAWRRFQKASQPNAKRSPRREPNDQWYRDMLYIEFIEKLIEWCNARRLSVIFDKRFAGIFDSNTGKIHISSRARPDRQFFYLVHEIGHYLIGSNPDHERFGKGYPQGDKPAHVENIVHKVACLEEEFEAWHRGWKLTRRLRIPVDRGEFDKIRIECLRSYIGWTHRRGR